MTTMINFEQFVEEVRAAYPLAQTICGTEQPLQFWKDGNRMEVETMLGQHRPVWLQIEPAQIPADGVTIATVMICSPARAGESIDLHLRHGSSDSQENITLDSEGLAEIEITSRTVGLIQMDLGSIPVRGLLYVVE